MKGRHSSLKPDKHNIESGYSLVIFLHADSPKPKRSFEALPRLISLLTSPNDLPESVFAYAKSLPQCVGEGKNASATDVEGVPDE